MKAKKNYKSKITSVRMHQETLDFLKRFQAYPEQPMEEVVKMLMAGKSRADIERIKKEIGTLTEADFAGVVQPGYSFLMEKSIWLKAWAYN